ncbi:peptidoglycan recognition protein family protein [Salinactinospora qingdaonensis]|uniref:N-acetylmuramoyl-L-alanine amidase n=1 Tax=Salinactinospora qingdaonensis TaxID=702744 RepID=A0ABP7FEZ1_9ACTN
MINIVSRGEWGARPPRNRNTVPMARRTEFVVHHSAGPVSQPVRSIQDFHMDSNGWSDIGYNLLVDAEGRAYEGRGWETVGAHASGHNISGIGVCFIGSDGDATDAAHATIRALYDEACDRAGHTLVKRGHRDVNATDCPGDDLYAWVRAGMPTEGPGGYTPTEPRVVAPGTEPPYAFPLPAGHWFGPPSADERNHSGYYWPDDRPHIRTYQEHLAERGWSIGVDGYHGPQTADVVRAFQQQARDEGHTEIGPADGLVGDRTWPWIWRKPVTSYGD